MIVGRDWGDEWYFVGNRGRDVPNNPTNETLRELLASINVQIGPPECSTAASSSLFFTNAVLCLKNGGMQAKVETGWFNNCGSRFLRPTIELIKPKVLVTLGERAYRNVSIAYQQRPIRFRDAVQDIDGFDVGSGIRLLPVYHCGKRILNTHRNMEQQRKDWQRIRAALDRDTRHNS